ncbi:uncharacterized protein TRIVIDRAFT_46710 [Trichoderma virens Gv29-8]|uniref:Uncharacterized protein n=1 Tax=Hypocrea virens (strain Gv29-8 / FGSC 10586) TaxID=413071 RepID=G9N1F4_HYPVG|nr:uncharacterized protein TRIVIDRAFT_46710 [Trichoderma virens Gv29-8]EHK19584.1 hypothetical protein TRIVIDRAFT_46710 [Trichoderma virens Gv29-8]UKZ58159.1 hypothetical protein TrVGV298_012025 [Trichoderma virens]
MSVKTKSFSERIIPISAKDQWRPIDNIRSLVFIVVRDILDGEFMKSSLDKLIRTHVPLLGAQIKPSGADGLLQYHLITPFPEDKEIFSWSTSNVASTLEDANLVPEHNPQRGITIFPDVTVMEPCWIPSDWPVRRDQDKPDTPLLLVHLTYYTNATIVTLNLPHCVSDQIGYGSVINSWIDVMKGKEPLPFIELPEDSLDGDKDISIKELHKKYEFRLRTKRERAEVLIGIVPELVVRSKETRCTLFLPVGLVNGLRDKWRIELKGKYGADAANITNGDVVVGIIAKFANLHRKKPKKQVITGPASVRGYHPLLPKTSHYLHNATVFTVSRTAISRSKPPVSEIAYGNRLAVLEALKPEKIERGLAVARELLRRHMPMHICEPWEFSYSTTNWCNAWHGIDFSVASAKKTGEAAEKKDSDESSRDDAKTIDGAASAPLIFGHSLERNHPNRLSAAIMSKGEGGYWVDFAAPNKGMAAIRALLERDPNLETI